VSAFFEPPPPPPEPPQHRQPEWAGPPENVLAGAFPLSLVLARTPDVALAVHGGLGYPNGFSFTLSIRLREANERMHRWHMHGGFDDDVLRFGVRFADGSKATIFNTGRHGEAPTGPLLIQRGGNGGGHAWDQAYWVWPLPPPGPFAFVCEWPSYGIAQTEVEIDTAAIHDAAARAETLWPDDDGPSGSGGTISVERVGWLGGDVDQVA
jgi:hypothetical protein